MQQQLWLVEQASAAERKYETSLKTLLNQAISDERAQEILLVVRKPDQCAAQVRIATEW